MSRDHGPLKKWMLANGYGNPETGVVSGDDCTRFAADLTARYPIPHITGESMRLVVHGYRQPGWELAFNIEVFTVGGVSAHDLRDERWYAKEAS
jgi:hypothetical protein